MFYYDGLDCCGIWELQNVEDPRESTVGREFDTFVQNEMFESFDGSYCGPAFIIFSTTQHSKNGCVLMKFINDHKLGLVTKRGPRVNPNSGNRLTVFTWGIDKHALKNYYKKLV